MAIGIAGIARYWPVRPTTRFTVTVPRGSDLQSFAVSPDGRYLAFAAGRSLETSLLFVRPIDSVDARPIPGTEGAVRPFWAPDSQRIGFASQGWLKTVALSGGSPQLLAEIGPVFFVGAWGTNDVILFSAASEIRRVSAAGGEVVPVTELTAAEESHGAVSFLPGGQRFLYGTATGRPGVYIGSLESTERRPLLPWFGRAQYASGFLLFNRDGALLAQAFDPDRLTFGGEPIRIADGLALGASVGAFSTSNAGVLAYRIEDADDTGLEQSRLVWYDRAGNPLGAVGAPDAYRGFELSPDGRYVAAHIHDGSSGGGIWVLDQQRSNDFGRLALGPEHVTSPTWSPGSERIMYTRNTGTRTSIHQRLVSGAGPETLVFDGAGLEYPTDWSPDAQFALIVEGTPANVEISAVPLSGEGTSAPGIRVTFPASAAFSPDGRWIAYDSAESGRDEVWVRPFLDSDEGGPWQISTRGGSYPRWARDGSELYYLTGDGTLMAVSVDAGESAFGVESSRELFTAANILLDLHAGASDIPYDVSPDGNRFLINERAASVSSESGNAQDGRIVVVVNWDSELRP